MKFSQLQNANVSILALQHLSHAVGKDNRPPRNNWGFRNNWCTTTPNTEWEMLVRAGLATRTEWDGGGPFPGYIYRATRAGAELLGLSKKRIKEMFPRDADV